MLGHAKWMLAMKSQPKTLGINFFFKIIAFVGPMLIVDFVTWLPPHR
jgi:hypothetical protein